MATLILGTVGRALGGPIGGLVGSLVGGIADRAIFGSGPTRDGPRLTDLAVQSSAYGQALPRLYGRMRIAGNVIWSSGISESVRHSGGGKRGPATNSYNYSASFAVAVSARPVAAIGRIWADGKLLRDGGGVYQFPATVRTYLGGEGQGPDPLIVAAEGIGQTPAYRGLAYVVFDDLPLADFANRIPNLTFEVIADGGTAVSMHTIAADLCADLASVSVAAMDMAVQGFVAGRAGTVRTQFEPLLEIADLTFVDDGSALAVASGPSPTLTLVDDNDLGAAAVGKPQAQRTDHRAAAATISDCITIGFSDPSRDYQFGLQRAIRRNPATHARQLDLTASLDPACAKHLAEQLLARSIARRTTADITLPWRYARLRVGDVIVAGPGGQPWRIRRSSCVGMVFELAVEALSGPVVGGLRSADGGRLPVPPPPPAGPTTLHVLDLPPLAGALPTTPRLWLAAAGASAGWQRADALVSTDAGDSYVVAATIALPTIMGSLLTPLANSAEDRWNRSDSVEIGLLGPGMWLESRTPAAVLAGANLALIGDEIVQFTTAEASAPGRFRLSGWLRGRRATVAVAHSAGERFVVLDTDRLAAFDPPPEAIGTTLRWKAAGPGDDLAMLAPTDAVIVGRALLPPAPVHFSAYRTTNGDWQFGWTRRSRAGFGWPDTADAPLAEESEAYHLEVRLDGRRVRALELGTTAWTYTSAAFAADGGATAFYLQAFVAQRSAVAGQGAVTAIEIALGSA